MHAGPYSTRCSLLLCFCLDYLSRSDLSLIEGSRCKMILHSCKACIYSTEVLFPTKFLCNHNFTLVCLFCHYDSLSGQSAFCLQISVVIAREKNITLAQNLISGITLSNRTQQTPVHSVLHVRCCNEFSRSTTHRTDGLGLHQQYFSIRALHVHTRSLVDT